jgi:RNA polymerase sigma factor (sigma-70 family)
MAKRARSAKLAPRQTDFGPQATLLYHFCRIQLPALAVSDEQFQRHLRRTIQVFESKSAAPVEPQRYLEQLYPVDWFITVGCLEGSAVAWECLFGARAGRSDCLLVDALRARAVRLYPRDEERQESAITEFWSHLLVPESAGAVPILARYDGQRPLVPWLIRVFQNWHISLLRQHGSNHPLPEDDVSLPLPAESEGRWHEAFCLAARDCFRELTDGEWLILGLRLRYRMSQREVANLLGVHEGTISRQTTQLRDRLLDAIGERLLREGWAGDDLSAFVLTEMANLMMDDPRLSVDQLARLLAARGKALPVSSPDEAG